MARKTKKVKTTKKNLAGVRFICRQCGAIFYCGGKTEEAWDALVKRVMKHWGPSHSEILAVNPPIGMVYNGLEDMPYKGGDVQEWYDSLKPHGGRSNGKPLFKTVKV